MELRKRKMIKWIKSIWEKLFTKKEDAEETKKEDAEEVAPVKIDHCGTHLWYKKSCPECKEAIK